MTPNNNKPSKNISRRSPRFYEDTSAEQLTTLAGIEQAVRNQMQKHVMPEVGVFCQQLQAQAPDTAPSKAFLENCL